MQRTVILIAALASVSLSIACAKKPPLELVTYVAKTVKLCADPTQAARIRFLGASGFLIRWGEDAILTGPFWSNPGLLRVGLWHIAPDETRIKARWPSGAELMGTRAVLVGHSHYDHLMDVGYLLRERPLDAPVFVNQTGSKQLSDPNLDVRVVNRHAGTWRRRGSWLAAGASIRVMPIESEHAPHFLGLTLMSGTRESALEGEPSTAWGWIDGQTHAFLIDLLDGDSIALRIHYEDSASSAPLGFPPLAVLAEHPVDVLLMCAASFGNVDNYPQGIVRDLEPAHVVVGHWEDFFRDPTQPARMVRMTNVPRFIEELRLALPGRRSNEWTLPEPGIDITIRFCTEDGK